MSFTFPKIHLWCYTCQPLGGRCAAHPVPTYCCRGEVTRIRTRALRISLPTELNRDRPSIRLKSTHAASSVVSKVCSPYVYLLGNQRYPISFLVHWNLSPSLASYIIQITDVLILFHPGWLSTNLSVFAFPFYRWCIISCHNMVFCKCRGTATPLSFLWINVDLSYNKLFKTLQIVVLNPPPPRVSVPHVAKSATPEIVGQYQFKITYKKVVLPLLKINRN